MGLQPASIRPFAVVMAMHALLLACVLWAISPKPWPGQPAQPLHAVLQGMLVSPSIPAASQSHQAAKPAHTVEVQPPVRSAGHAQPKAPLQPSVAPSAEAAATSSKSIATEPAPAVANSASNPSPAANSSDLNKANATALAEAPKGDLNATSDAQARESAVGSASMPPNSFLADLLRRLARHKTYPSELKQQKMEGRVVLTFTLDAQGRVTKAEVTRSSGHSPLDQAALSMVQAASPLPPIPPSMNRQTLTLSVPIEYSLIRDR